MEIIATVEMVLAASSIILPVIIGVATQIPGKEPEETLQKILDFITKFSRK